MAGLVHAHHSTNNFHCLFHGALFTMHSQWNNKPTAQCTQIPQQIKTQKQKSSAIVWSQGYWVILIGTLDVVLHCFCIPQQFDVIFANKCKVLLFLGLLQGLILGSHTCTNKHIYKSRLKANRIKSHQHFSWESRDTHSHSTMLLAFLYTSKVLRQAGNLVW